MEREPAPLSVLVDIDAVRQLAVAAGRAILAIRDRGFRIETKADASPVTEADREAEAIITAGLEKLTPDVPIVGEEAVAAGRIQTVGTEPFWLVDALDGTKEFVKNGTEYTVNIALIENGVPVLGVVHAPSLGATYWASAAGAFAETRTVPARRVRVRPQPSEGLTAVVSRSHYTADTTAYLAALRIHERRPAGSSLKFCIIAAGEADIYPRFGPTHEWDTAAGHAVLRFAGGSVTKIDGRELLYGKPDFKNPAFVAVGGKPTPDAFVLAPDERGITRAADLLRAGELVAIPTETVYGLAGDATNDRAVAKIFAAKDRPDFNPLIIHVASLADAERLITLTAAGQKLAAAFWPGPLTLVGARRPDCAISRLASSGLDTLAVRVPGHPVARAVIEAAGRPLAAPSANRSGRLSPTMAIHVRGELGGRIAAIVDGGSCRVGLESTVVDLTGDPTLLRPGGIPAEAIEQLIGPLAPPPDVASGSAARRSPGMLAQHYAPDRPLRLDAMDRRPNEAFLAFGSIPSQASTSGEAGILNLSLSGDLEEAAANLFAMLRTLDRPPFTAIAVMAIPRTGLGRAINDRLQRAAAKPL